jgi:transposase-like protein
MRPSGSCTVCASPDREAIDRALITKTGSLRSLARQFSLGKDALYRHSKHTISPVNMGSKDIDEEIIRLRRAQANAERRRDNAAAMKISAELRNWMTLKVKAESYQAPEKAADQGISRREAVAIAQQLIEMELAAGTPGIRDWVEEIFTSISKAVTTVSTTSGLKSANGSELSA